MTINILIHGTIQSIKKRKNMFPKLFHGIEIGGIIYTENGMRTVIKENPKQKKKETTEV